MSYVALQVKRVTEDLNERAAMVRRIEMLRQRLQWLYNERGRTDEAVLRASMELDEVINQYQRGFF